MRTPKTRGSPGVLVNRSRKTSLAIDHPPAVKREARRAHPNQEPPRRRARRSGRLAVALLGALALSAVSTTVAAAADTIVAVGDSAISGEAGRWAGNTNGPPWAVDALGESAYYDNDAGDDERIHGCHRSGAAQVHIGGGVTSVNLACSGAKTMTDDTGSDFKPGLDSMTRCRQGSSPVAAGVRRGAPAFDQHRRGLIGSNNYGFKDIAMSCVTAWAGYQRRRPPCRRRSPGWPSRTTATTTRTCGRSSTLRTFATRPGT